MTTTIWVINYRYWDSVDEESYEYFHIDEDGFYTTYYGAQRACDSLNSEKQDQYWEYVNKMDAKNAKRKEGYENKLLDHVALQAGGRPSKVPTVPVFEEVLTFDQWVRENYITLASPKALESRD